ncbi:MAG: SufS family cysteine desulfurase [Candidatus Gracilibacteria bacterium]
MFDIQKIRQDFPILTRQVHDKPLVYLDNAATSQKPSAVIDSLVDYYTRYNSNVHRGVHTLSEEATHAYEHARETVRRYINAASTKEIIFVRGATEAINLVAATWGKVHIQKDDEILITTLEHHANLVPWQLLCEEKGAKLKVVPITSTGEVRIENVEAMLSNKTKLVACAHISNALGTILPVEEIIRSAHEKGIPVLIDGCQAVPHMRVDMQKLDADFYVFSGHKIFAPTGIGILYGKETLLNAMPPYQSGGDMISSVSFEKTTFNELPYKFEAGTPDIAGAIGLGAALEYLEQLDWDEIAKHEKELLEYATTMLQEIPGLQIIGTAPQKASVISFTLGNIHPHDVGTICDMEGVALRTGHHCAQPVMESFNVPATTRASFAFYNTKEEIEMLVKALYKVLSIFA